ncbi:MAG: YfcE family phosphodiesterase [Anaerolineae bacterium]|nr:YfcE family phosphodiesterase [Anaerolineae bacterium]
MKIGLIGDTHVPSLSPVLSAHIEMAFSGLDIILHVGDICELYVLKEFQEKYTLTIAVAGESDSEEVRRYVDEKRVVSFGQRRIGMIHGHQFEAQHHGMLDSLRRWLKLRPSEAAFEAFLLSQFADDQVDAIVYGHTHQPYVGMHGNILLFNPGAAVAIPGHRASVGILDVGIRNITGKVVYL